MLLCTWLVAGCGGGGGGGGGGAPKKKQPAVLTTAASPPGGIYGSAQSVTLTCTPGASGSPCVATYYTTDGSPPTDASNLYSVPIAISANTTLRFFSKDAANTSETPKQANYVTECTLSWTASKETGVNSSGGGYRVYYKATAGVTTSDSSVNVNFPASPMLQMNDASGSPTPYKCSHYFRVQAFSTENSTGSALSSEVRPPQ